MAILNNEMGGINESNVSPQQVIIKYTLISAGVGIVLTLLSSMMGIMSKGLGAMMLLFVVSISISIMVLVYAVKEHRDQQLGGLITFNRVFMVTAIIMLLSGIISQLFSYVYSNYINPNAISEVLEATRSMMEKMNLPDEAIDKAIQEAETNAKSPMAIVKGIAWTAAGSAIVAAIIGAIMKKVPRPF
jgi:predicted Co/Zn/Cd cation transporter (cation efflux family)